MGKILVPIIFILINLLIDKKKENKKKTTIENKNPEKIKPVANNKPKKNNNRKNKDSIEDLIGSFIDSIKPHLSPEDQKKYANKTENKKVSNKKETNEVLESIRAERENIKNDNYTPISSEFNDEIIELDVKKEFTRDELVKAIIMKEILDKPVSLRES
ncbi:hypothetical protein SAMN00017477_0688 [Peptoniphilus asaccharolyticus DSM 20463]|uniref:Uncharacterized protein n=1 Tax=Peptoniphilus asaccharolyticus DSM 20463 TaxID=573058 RepID=A0A1W1UU69_PEPAS|nr:hypothetical protein [Peptoniphilus asaccharolyticus]MBL7575188.1 hypothetical protein [Peptoniphilus asaccharolyticus]SMB84613.1 hypothetical protein SAMN00017477_0688 [Peptoniphilus asaccharolyticus DSM 20463]